MSFLLVFLVLLTACGVQTVPVSTPTLTSPPTPLPTEVETPTPKQILPTATQEPQLEGEVSLWYSWNDAEGQALMEVISMFRERHPQVLFDVLYIPFDELKTRYESGMGMGRGPNLLIGPSQWGPTLFDAKMIQDISGLFDLGLFRSLNSAAEDGARYQGARIGLPFALSGVLLFRNKSIVAEAQPTFGDLVTTAQSVTQGGYVGAYLDRGIFFSGGHLEGIGGQLMDEDGNPAFNNEKGLQWLHLLKSFENAGPVEFNGDQDAEFFQAGKVGVIIDGSWNTTVFSNAIGPENLAVDPWPAYQQGHLSGYVQTQNLYLNANISQSDVIPVVTFMEYLLGAEAQTILAEAGFIPSVPSTQVPDVLIQQEMDAFGRGTAYPVSPQADLYWDPLEQAMISVLEKGGDPTISLQQASDTINAQLEGIR